MVELQDTYPAFVGWGPNPCLSPFQDSEDSYLMNMILILLYLPLYTTGIWTKCFGNLKMLRNIVAFFNKLINYFQLIYSNFQQYDKLLIYKLVRNSTVCNKFNNYIYQKVIITTICSKMIILELIILVKSTYCNKRNIYNHIGMSSLQNVAGVWWIASKLQENVLTFWRFP